MRTLVVPDVHEDLVQWGKVLPLVEDTLQAGDEVVFLGDWFDTFHDHHVEAMCAAIRGYSEAENVTMLLGNHDCHYAFDHRNFPCSGYNPRTKAITQALLGRDVWERFKVFTRAQGYLLSHAGFHENTIPYCYPEIGAEAIKTGLDGGFDPIFSPGKARGGWAPIGGPTWLDWNYEFEPIDNLKQIVGHTRGTKVREKGASYCIDTGLHHVAIIEDGVVTIKELK